MSILGLVTEPEVKTEKFSAGFCNFNLNVESGILNNLEIKSNGKISDTKVKINGEEVLVKRMVIDFDPKNAYAEVCLEILDVGGKNEEKL